MHLQGCNGPAGCGKSGLLVVDAGNGVCQERLRNRRGPRLQSVLSGEGLVPDQQVLMVLLEVVELQLQLSRRAPRKLQLEAHTLHGLPLLRVLRLCQARQDLHHALASS